MFCRMTAALCAASALAFSGAMASPCAAGKRSDGLALSPTTPLTLQTALDRVRSSSPEVLVAGLEAYAAAAEARQAGSWNNPVLAIEVENFEGTGALAGFDQSERTVALSQVFELGDQRRLRERAADARAAAASAECAVLLREAELQTALAFTDLSAARERAAFAADAAALGADLARVVARRVEAGAAAPPELSRAKATAANLSALAAQADANVATYRYALASLWGDPDVAFADPASDLPLPGGRAADDLPALGTHPAIQAAEADMRAREAERRAARAAGLPDVTVSAGIRTFEGTGEEAYVAGISLPLPLFDRNRDAARARAFEREAASVSRAATEARLLARQRTAVATLTAARTRHRTLADDALPAAEEAWRAAIRGYEAGKFDLTTTLDARRTLIDTHIAAIDAKRAERMADLRLRALIGDAPFQGPSQ